MSTAQQPHAIAYFISPHGFGHAARACAVMNSLGKLVPTIRFHIFTTLPEWFFKDSLEITYQFHSYITDIGLVQNSPLVEDLDATIMRLDSFIPFKSCEVLEVVKIIKHEKCLAVVCDISPIGIFIAKEAELPSILIENFTWDWIYEGYSKSEPRFYRYIPYLRSLVQMADYHIQCEPVCTHDLRSNLTTTPISRPFRISPEAIRVSLNIPSQTKIVLITMGGIQGNLSFVDKCKNFDGAYFVIPGSYTLFSMFGNIRLLPHHSSFFHPDLVQASDLVIGKTGYSTIAEVFSAGIPFGYISRNRFRESSILEHFIQDHIGGFEITEDQFQTGDWLSEVHEWLQKPRRINTVQNGAEQASKFIYQLLW
jgi:hypothetical protein